MNLSIKIPIGLSASLSDLITFSTENLFTFKDCVYTEQICWHCFKAKNNVNRSISWNSVILNSHKQNMEYWNSDSACGLSHCKTFFCQFDEKLLPRYLYLYLQHIWKIIEIPCIFSKYDCHFGVETCQFPKKYKMTY